MTYNILDNSQKLNQLDWSIFVAQYNSYCVFKRTSKLFESENFSKNQLVDIYQQVDSLSTELDNHSLPVLLQSFTDLNPELDFAYFLKKASKEDFFEVTELNDYVLALECALSHLEPLHLKGVSRLDFKEFNSLRKILKQNFRSFVNLDGSIEYSKHPILKKLYHSQLTIESKSRQKIQHCTQEQSLKNALQFEGHDLINERYVVAIKSDSYQYKFGSIISRSESGRTLFVELPELATLNSDRLNLIYKINTIVESLFNVFLKSLSLELNRMRHLFNLLENFDKIRSRCLFNSIFELSKPEFTSQCTVEVKQFFHPLIENPIKNDLSLCASDAGLIISGPNTGGKTATIKTLVLIQLFIKKGLYVPASSCKTFVFDKIFYFSHDNQDLTQGLSSFSSEVQTYIQLIEELSSSNLVVVDEIFNSTSSEEASALAIGLFEEFLKFDSTKIIVSTHHQTLKSLMHTKENYLSAHVGFDSKTSLPTYNLHIGTPGASQAIEIFRSLSSTKSFSSPILKKALNILDKKMINYESLLEKISIKENELNKLILDNKRLNQDAINIKESAKGLANLKISEDVALASKRIKSLEDELLNTLKMVRRGEISSKSTILARSSKAKQELSGLNKIKKSSTSHSNLSSPATLEVGKVYFSTFLNQSVTLKSFKGNKAFVMKGSMTINCPKDSLMLANASASKGVKDHDFQFSLPESNVNLEYDCRGMRLVEFESLVNETLVGLFNGQVPYINYIHGHGDGILKKWIRSFIKRSNELEMFKDKDGNDGQTRIHLSQ